VTLSRSVFEIDDENFGRRGRFGYFWWSWSRCTGAGSTDSMMFHISVLQ